MPRFLQYTLSSWDFELKGFVVEPATAQNTWHELKGSFLVVQGGKGLLEMAR